MILYICNVTCPQIKLRIRIITTLIIFYELRFQQSLVLVCVLRLRDIFSTLLQATTPYGLMQILKFVEGQTKEMSHRKRINVGVDFLCVKESTLFQHAHSSSCTIFLSTLYPTSCLCGCGSPQWITRKNAPLLLIITGTNSPPIIKLNLSKQLNHIKRVLFTSNSQNRNFLDDYKDFFGEISTVLKVQYNNIDQSIIPVLTLQGQLQ